MPGIYVSYPRQDSASATRLADHMRQHLPGVTVVAGIETIEPGQEFTDVVDRNVQSCDVMLAVIGPHWASAADDATRLEIAAALQRPEVRVIPVLVDGAQMPDAADLPADLRALCRRQAVVLSEEHWDFDAAELTRMLSRMLEKPASAAASEPAAVRAPPTPAPMASRPGPWSVVQRGLQQLRRAWRGPGTVGEDAGADPGIEDGAPATAGRPPEHDTQRELSRTRYPAPETMGAVPPVTPAVAAEPVHLGASAPRRVKPGDEFTARFVAYTAEHEGEIRATLAELSPRSESHLNLRTCQWQPGTTLGVRLAARGLDIALPQQEFVWNGSKALVEFDVAVPKSAALGTTVLKFDVLIEGVTIAMLRLDLEIADQTSAEAAQASGSAARTAFASYSSQDRQRVLDRIDAVRIAAGLDIFLDCLSLKPSEQWKLRLDSEIRQRDLFMLFWSAAAAQSQWVEWEWREALALKGLGAMQIHPLENGVEPPRELEALHFGSVAMYARVADAARQAPAG